MEPSRVKVVIIGAGISGIGAANKLISEGFDDFVILEADKRVGGRVHSVDLETDPSHRVELGANWIHGNVLNPIYKIATENNLLSTQYEGRHLGRKMLFVTETGEPVNTKYVQDVDLHFGMLIGESEEFYKNEIPTPMENDSIGAFVEREFEEKITRHRGRERRMRQMICSQRLAAECMICGADSMYDVALSEAGCFEDLPGIHYVIPPGFETILDILRRDIPNEKILLEHQVSRICWDRNGENSAPTLVECTNGAKFAADIVLVTVSLGYLKAHASRLFDPALPKVKQGAISRVGMGTVDKVILEFDGQILPDEVFRLETVWDRESWMDDDAEKRRENLSRDWVRKFAFFEAVSDNVLVGWLSGMEAEYMEQLTEEEIGRACVEILARFLSRTTPNLPNLKKVSRSTWKTNPYSQGAYCHIPVGSTAEDIVTLSQPVSSSSSNKDVLLFAGEATHPTFYSSSHGALLTGRKEAERILTLFNSSPQAAAAAAAAAASSSTSSCRTPER